jgi:FKBP-type peptidyl-prolyl cis-trans isomerase FkpA
MIFELALLLAAPPASAAPKPPAAQAAAPVVTTASGLRIQTLAAGTGPAPGPDDAVLITYEGRLLDGKVFDKSEQPVGMMVSGTVPGFAEALQLMRMGGTYRIWIPPQLAYGDKGAGGGAVPPGATLDFTLTLLDIGRPAPPPPAAPPSPPAPAPHP